MGFNVALTFLVGNTWGSSTWIMKMLREGGLYAPDDRLRILLAWGLLVTYFGLIGFSASKAVKSYFTKRI